MKTNLLYIGSLSDLLRIRSASDNICRENQNSFCVQIFFFKYAAHEIKWRNTVEPEQPPTTLWRISIASFITKVIDTHSEYVLMFLPAAYIGESALTLLLYVYFLHYMQDI
jgi:hypothetical protein